ncbi:hypothetical protein [Dryocola sp. BD613]|uniref:hypothetical protein n=1 Tax=Dryocola sp. BD613 TaxID=3133272 RepID=UPI003F4F69D9
MPGSHHQSHRRPDSVKPTPDLSGTAGNDDLSLTALECLLVLKAYKKPGIVTSLLPEMQGIDTENIKNCLHNLIDKGLLQDKYRAGSESRYFALSARGEEAVGNIRATWKALMGQPSVSVMDICTALDVLTLLDPQGAYKTARQLRQYN